MKNTIKRLVFIACVIALIVGMMGTATATGKPTIAVQKKEVNTGTGTQDVTVDLSLSGNTGLAGVQLKLRYAEGLTLKSVATTGATALTDLVFTVPDNLSENPLMLPWDGLDADTTNGKFLTLTFAVPDTEEKSFDITVEPVVSGIYDADLVDVEVEIENGAITVVRESTHVWDQGEETKNPTCTEAGVKTYTCGTCGATKTEPVAKLGHANEYSLYETGDEHVVGVNEVCARGDHEARAILTAADAVYTGEEIKNATVKYTEGWEGGELTVTYANNLNAGDATAAITVGGVTATAKFTISRPVYGGGGVSSATKEETKEEEKEEEKPAVKTYSDVVADAWYAESVNFVTEKGLMNGVSENRFAPENTVTRNMVMTVLARLAGAETEGGANWYAKAMEWAVAQGITDGSNAEGVITREQLVTMLYRYMGSPEVTGDLSKYTDAASVSDWAVKAMTWAVENGIVTGMTETTLGAEGETTRAQLATILMRFVNLTAK